MSDERNDPPVPVAPLFELQSAGYRQQDAVLLHDADWTVQPGQHWAILGPNGSGKTTLLKIATGYLWYTSGCVLRQGRELKDLGQWRRQIGWISSDVIALIPPDETALETVVSGRFAQFGLKYLQSTTPTKEDFQQAANELDRINCTELAKKRFRMLSQGERQQVLIARTRMAGPLLLVLDEPCAGMDPGVRERFLNWLSAHLTQPSFPTVLLVTHHVEEIVPGFDYALIMQEGRIRAEGSVEQVVTDANLEAIFQLPIDRIERHNNRRWPIWSTPGSA